MIVFIKADGSVINVLPSPVYQGSSLSGSLYLVAPYPNTNAATVSFTLPNGKRTETYAMTAISSLQGITDALGSNYSVWEWQTENGEITALAGTVTAQLAIAYNGQLQTTAAVNFTVQEGSLPLSPTAPSADQWDTLIALYGNLSGRVLDLEKAVNDNLVDFTCKLVTEEAANYYEFTKTYTSGATVTFRVPALIADGEIIEESGLVIIEFTENSIWQDDGGQFSLAFSPVQTTYDSSRYTAQLSVLTQSGSLSGYATISDSVFIGSDGSLLITSDEKYSGRIVLDGDKVYSGYVGKINDAVEKAEAAVESAAAAESAANNAASAAEDAKLAAAQSAEDVNEVKDNKLDKIIPSIVETDVYVARKDFSGPVEQTSLVAAVTPQASRLWDIMMRQYGRSKILTPEDNDGAASPQDIVNRAYLQNYVDSYLRNILETEGGVTVSALTPSTSFIGGAISASLPDGVKMINVILQSKSVGYTFNSAYVHSFFVGVDGSELGNKWFVSASSTRIFVFGLSITESKVTLQNAYMVSVTEGTWEQLLVSTTDPNENNPLKFYITKIITYK